MGLQQIRITAPHIETLNQIFFVVQNAIYMKANLYNLKFQSIIWFFKNL